MKFFSFSIAMVLLLAACAGPDAPVVTESGAVISASAPANLPFQIMQSFPHDTGAFTEGFQFVEGQLLESTGLYGKSDLRRYELQSGKITGSVKLDQKYFGEGCVQLKGKIYQLTYEQNTCLVYDAATLKKINEFPYSFGEGWGLTTDGRSLIISNGGSNIFFYNPETFKEVKRIGVTNQYGPVANINELEMIKGFIYANIWQRDDIIKIDPNSGRVVGQINLADLRDKAGILPADRTSDYVLNGIAYDSIGNRIFITGKNWPKIFEVKFDN